jgi:hypothetical protein
VGKAGGNRLTRWAWCVAGNMPGLALTHCCSGQSSGHRQARRVTMRLCQASDS